MKKTCHLWNVKLCCCRKAINILQRIAVSFSSKYALEMRGFTANGQVQFLKESKGGVVSYSALFLLKFFFLVFFHVSKYRLQRVLVSIVCG